MTQFSAKRILIVAPYAIFSPHHETDLEIAQTHLDSGDDVSWVGCFADLPFCDANPLYNMRRCLLCRVKGTHGRSILRGRIGYLPLPLAGKSFRPILRPILTDACNLEKLRTTTIEKFDLGEAALSSLIDATRDPQPDLQNPLNKKLLESICLSALRMYFGILDILREQRYDIVYVFNGRFAPLRAVIRAAQAKGIDFVTHERGATQDKYSLYPNVLPHDLMHARKEIERLWRETGPEGGQVNARRFFEKSRRGEEIGWRSFVSAQVPDKLPDGWDKEKYNCVFFTSSDDEYEAVEEQLRWGVYRSQTEGITDLVKNLGQDTKMAFWVRIHPHQGGMPAKRLAPFLELSKEPRIKVIAPGQDISTYAMMLASDCVVTFGSTVGIEAAYWKKPSVSLREAYYRGLGSTYDPVTRQDAIALLANRNLPPKPRLGAMKYGNYRMSYGTSFRYFEPDSLFSGRFHGIRIGNVNVFRKAALLFRGLFENRLKRLH